MEALSLVGIVVGLGLLIFLALRGWHILLIAPVAAAIVLLISGENIVSGLTGPYMDGFAGFAKKLFLIFWVGTIFAKIMEDSGAALSISHFVLKIVGKSKPTNVVLALLATTLVLTYGGVTVWVVIFAMAPIARAMFKEADLSWHFFPGIFVLGCWTAAMTMLPGTPQVHNIIPTRYLGTTPMAAPIVGIVAAIVVLGLGISYFSWALGRSKKAGEGYAGSDPKGEKVQSSVVDVDRKLPSPILAVLPSIVLLVVMNALKLDPFSSFAIAIGLCFVLFWKYLENPAKTAIDGSIGCAIPLINTCADVGFGKVVASVAGFALVKGMLANLGDGYLSMAVATNIMTGITGSASGGLGIVMEIFSKQWIASGLNPEAIHRIAVIAAGGFDSLPHNGAVITLLAVVGLSHKQAYKHMFISSVIFPVCSLIVAIPVAMMLY